MDDPEPVAPELGVELREQLVPERLPVGPGDQLGQRKGDEEREGLPVDHVSGPLEIRLDRIAEPGRLDAPPGAGDEESGDKGDESEPNGPRLPRRTTIAAAATTMIGADWRTSAEQPSKAPTAIPR